MSDLNALVLKSFGIRAKRIVKEKAYYICDTAEGRRVIQKTPETGERLCFRHAIKEKTYQNGYPWINRYYLASNGLPYVSAAGEHYVMTAHLEGTEVDFSDSTAFLAVIAAIAHWHQCARDASFGLTPFVQPIPFTALCRRHEEELSSVRKRINHRSSLSDFDVLFIKNAEAYAKQIKNTLQQLEQTQYASRYAQALAEGHICHNDLKEDSMRLNDHHIYIMHYDDALVDCQLNDLCSLIRRYGQQAGANALPVSCILEAYDRVRPLSQADIEIIQVLLPYPSLFMKLVTQYYSKKRTWTPNALLNRMQAAVSERDAYETYYKIHPLPNSRD